MKIIVNRREAVLKQGFSFDYTSENRLFMGRDAYTLTIPFPLRDCPRNLAIFGHVNRVDRRPGAAQYDCTIQTERVTLTGTLIVVKITEAEVECQFAAGRCAQTATDPFSELLITALDLGAPSTTNPADLTPAQAWRSIDEGATEVALPWVNENAPTAPNNWATYSAAGYAWHSEVQQLSWQPYLITIAKRVCEAIGYEYDFTAWEQSAARFLIVCNTLPGPWEAPQYAKAMPAWTVSELFENLEKFLFCEFDFDHKAKTVRMRFSKDVVAEIPEVRISDTLTDTFGSDIAMEGKASCNYIGAKRLAYKECSHAQWNYYSCDWFVAKYARKKSYATLRELIDRNKRTEWTDDDGTQHVDWGGVFGEATSSARGNTTLDALLYAEDIDTHFVFRSIGTEQLYNETYNEWSQVYVLQPVNVFGSGSEESDDTATEEIPIVPVCIRDTYVSANDDRGMTMYLSPSTFSEPSSPTYDPTATAQEMPAALLEAGKSDRQANYYGELYVGFWDGTIAEPGRHPAPAIDSVMVTQQWEVKRFPGFSMRLHGRTGSPLAALPKVNPKEKFQFSWVSSSIPNPRAIFHIKGKRYVCEKITATFTQKGMSQLLKGEFYPLAED